MTELPEPQCRAGYTHRQVHEILGDREADFQRWMRGQTMMLCNADPQYEWRPDPSAPGGMVLVEVGPSLCDEPHGSVVYRWDLERYLAGAPIID